MRALSQACEILGKWEDKAHSKSKGFYCSLVFSHFIFLPSPPFSFFSPTIPHRVTICGSSIALMHMAEEMQLRLLFLDLFNQMTASPSLLGEGVEISLISIIARVTWNCT